MAEPIRNYAKLANDIIREVGGKENIVNATRCATRLRLVLTELPEGAKEKISEMPGVITAVEKGGQFQVVIGNHVGDVFEEVTNVLGLANMQEENGAENKQNIFNRIIATMSAVFAPLVYMLAGAGMLQGILIIIKNIYPAAAEAGTFQIFDLMSWAPFTFLPIFIAVTASKHFKCNEFIALMCGAALVSPTFTAIISQVSSGESFTLFGFQLASTAYTSTVLPPILLVWALSYLERFVKKHLPDVVKQLLTPIICYVVMVPLTLLIIGPISEIVANGIATGYNFLEGVSPIITAALGGGLWEVLVIFGVHWGMTPVMLMDIAKNGSNTLDMYIAFAVAAQMGAAFGVAFKSRNKELKNVSISAGVTAIFGITEPAIYGVTLKYKKPFICSCVAAAIASVVSCFMHSTYFVFSSLPGPITFANAMGGEGMSSFIGAIIGTIVAIILAFVFVQIVGFDDPKEKTEKIDDESLASLEQEEVSSNMEVKEEIVSPMNGKVVALSSIHDEVFSSGAMGLGVAVEPSEGKVYAPADGEVSMLFDTFHAIGIQTKAGAEILIHVGMDTVQLNGQFFTPHIENGAKIKKGDLLLEFDMDQIKAAGYELTTPIIITNADNYTDVKAIEGKEMKVGETIIQLS